MASVLGLARFNVFSKNTNCLIITPTRQLKSLINIKWVRPEKIPSFKPEVSGDLKPLGTIDLKQFPTPYKSSQELQSADEIVQRLNTLEFFPRSKLKEEFLIQYTDRVKRHMLDDDSPEVIIARMTATIRNLQIHMEKHPVDVINKVRLKELIDSRNKKLNRLRSSDYKRFEWLLEKLDIQFKVFGFNLHERVERKRSLRRLTMLYITKLKAERLAQYKELLESQKEGFVKDKLEKLIWIKKTEEEYDIPSTVTEKDIEAVQKQLQDLHVVQPKAIAE